VLSVKSVCGFVELKTNKNVSASERLQQLAIYAKLGYSPECHVHVTSLGYSRCNKAVKVKPSHNHEIKPPIVVMFLNPTLGIWCYIVNS